MKMWVSVTSSGEVGSIIKNEHLQIESYTERLVSMFNAIVSRDAQSPHGKFFYVAQRLQERFAHIKEGASPRQFLLRICRRHLLATLNTMPGPATVSMGRQRRNERSRSDGRPTHSHAFLGRPVPPRINLHIY